MAGAKRESAAAGTPEAGGTPERGAENTITTRGPAVPPGSNGTRTDGVQSAALSLPMEPLFVRPFPWWKRTMDIAGGFVGLVLFAIPMLLIAAAIRLDSKGPGLFKQKRGGRGGRPFSCYKFRTMGVDAEARKQDLLQYNERSGVAFKMRNDPRVTRVGRLLRKTSLDELPQFFNVLRGDMSLVGPRPLPVSEDQEYDPWHKQRLELKPGITCIWQIYSRDESCFDTWVRQDLQYIRNCSFWLDVKLLLLTVPAVVLRKGAS